MFNQADEIMSEATKELLNFEVLGIFVIILLFSIGCLVWWIKNYIVKDINIANKLTNLEKEVSSALENNTTALQNNVKMFESAMKQFNIFAAEHKEQTLFLQNKVIYILEDIKDKLDKHDSKVKLTSKEVEIVKSDILEIKNISISAKEEVSSIKTTLAVINKT